MSIYDRPLALSNLAIRDDWRVRLPARDPRAGNGERISCRVKIGSAYQMPEETPLLTPKEL